MLDILLELERPYREHIDAVDEGYIRWATSDDWYWVSVGISLSGPVLSTSFFVGGLNMNRLQRELDNIFA